MHSVEHTCVRCSVNVIYSTNISDCITGNIEFIISASTTISYLPTCVPGTFFCGGLPASGNGLVSAQVSTPTCWEGTVASPPPSSDTRYIAQPCLLHLLPLPQLSLRVNADRRGLHPLSLAHSVSASGAPLGTVPLFSFVGRGVIKKSKPPNK